MKTALLSLLALGAFAMAVGPVDRAAADEPVVLTNAQLDRVTAGLLLPAVQQAREAAANSGALPTDRVNFNFNHFHNAVTKTGQISVRSHARLIGY